MNTNSAPSPAPTLDHASTHVSVSTSPPSGVPQLLDQLLRGRERFFDSIFSGEDVPALCDRFFLLTVALSAVYGVSMGVIGFEGGIGRGALQSLSSMVKVPLLYLASLLVCYPVLYIVLALMGAKLSFRQTLALIMMALALNSLLLASCAPIVLFFTLTGSAYDFIKLLHVAVFAFSGGWAMVALWRGLQTMCEKSDLYPRQAVKILKVWMLIFGFVGTQMAWSLRPFVGSPNLGFQLFRAEQQGNFYSAVASSVVHVCSGTSKAVTDPSRAPETNTER